MKEEFINRPLYNYNLYSDKQEFDDTFYIKSRPKKLHVGRKLEESPEENILDSEKKKKINPISFIEKKELIEHSANKFDQNSFIKKQRNSMVNRYPNLKNRFHKFSNGTNKFHLPKIKTGGFMSLK